MIWYYTYEYGMAIIGYSKTETYMVKYFCMSLLRTLLSQEMYDKVSHENTDNMIFHMVHSILFCDILSS